MPFIPDPSAKKLDRKELLSLRVKNSQSALNNSRIEEARAKEESGFTNTIVRLVGMQKPVDVFARAGGRAMSSPEERKFIPKPTRGEMAGAIGQTALLAYPGATAAKVLGKAGSFLGAGVGYDVTENLLDGKTGASVLTPGFGTAIGSIPIAGKALGAAKNKVQKIAADQAPRIINSIIKPLQKDFSYGKNPGRAVAGMKANSFEELITKISEGRQKAGQEIGFLGDRLEGKVVLNLRESLKPINDAMDVAAKQNNQTLLQRLNSVKQSITENLQKGLDEAGNPTIISAGARNLDQASFKEAREIMRSIGDVTQFTGNPSDDKLVNSALKRVYGKAKEITIRGAEMADPNVAAQFRKATERYADLTSAEIAAKYRDKIMERQNLISFGQTTVGLGGALATAIATGGAAVPTIIAGMGAAGLQKALGSTAVKTRLASWLSKLPKKEAKTMLDRFPKLEVLFKTRTPGDILLDTPFGKKLKEGVQNMKGKGGLSIQDVSKMTPEELKRAGLGSLLSGKKPSELDGIKTAVGNIFEKGTKKVKRGILNEMADFTDYAAKQKTATTKTLVAEEIRAREIAKKLGWSPEMTNWNLAKRFGALLQKNNWQPKK